MIQTGSQIRQIGASPTLCKGENSAIILQVQPTLHTPPNCQTNIYLLLSLSSAPRVVLSCFQSCADPQQLILCAVVGCRLLQRIIRLREGSTMPCFKPICLHQTLSKCSKKISKVPKYTNHLVQIALFEVYFVCTKKYQKELKRSKNTNNFG